MNEKEIEDIILENVPGSIMYDDEPDYEVAEHIFTIHALWSREKIVEEINFFVSKVLHSMLGFYVHSSNYALNVYYIDIYTLT